VSRTLAAKVPDDWGVLIDEYCQQNGVTKSDVVKAAIAAYLNINQKPEPPSENAVIEKLDLILERLGNLEQRVVDLEQEPVKAIAQLEPATEPVVNLVNPETEIVLEVNESPRSPIVNPEPPSVNPRVNREIATPKPQPKQRMALSYGELCRFKELDGDAIAGRAKRAGMTKEEALEFESGWRFTRSTWRFTP